MEQLLTKEVEQALHRLLEGERWGGGIITDIHPLQGPSHAGRESDEKPQHRHSINLCGRSNMFLF